MTFLPSNSLSPFLPTSQVFPEDEVQRLIVHNDIYTNVAIAVNQREIGVYETVEAITGQQFFNPTNAQQKRLTYRRLYVIGAIAAGATLTTAHGITGFSTLTFTRISGTAITAAGTFNKVPIPYASATLITDQIQIDADDTNFRIINGATASNIASGIVILEYLKN